MFMRKMWKKIGAAVRDVYDEGNGLVTAAGNQITEPAFKARREKRSERTISRKKKETRDDSVHAGMVSYACMQVRTWCIHVCVCDNLQSV